MQLVCGLPPWVSLTVFFVSWRLARISVPVLLCRRSEDYSLYGSLDPGSAGLGFVTCVLHALATWSGALFSFVPSEGALSLGGMWKKTKIKHPEKKNSITSLIATLWGYLQTKPETLVFWGPAFGTWSGLCQKGTNSLATCMFLSLFALWCWRLKVAYSKLIFGQRRAFRNKKRRTWRFVRFHTPRTICFYSRAQNARATKFALENFHKFAFHPRSHLSTKVWARWTPPGNYWRGRALATETSCTSWQPTDSHSYRDLPGHILKSCPSSSATITINDCCTTDQACPRCPTSAHGKRSTSLCSPSARLPTSPGCVLCRPPPPRRSRSCYPPSLYQVWPWGCVAHSGRNPQIASFAERGSPPTAG